MAALEIDRSTDDDVFFRGKFKGQVLEFLKVKGCHRSESVDWVTWFNQAPAVVPLMYGNRRLTPDGQIVSIQRD